MRRRTAIATVLATALFSGAGGAWAPQEATDARALTSFADAVDAYMTLHRSVERTLPPLTMSRDVTTILAKADAMAAAMRAARPHAQSGDIFGSAGPLLRHRIVEALRVRGSDPAAMLASAGEPEGEAVPPPPVVNERYSWGWPAFAPPSVLAALPPLPGELQYRFVGRDLVLIDLHASLIVDVLPDAFPLALD